MISAGLPQTLPSKRGRRPRSHFTEGSLPGGSRACCGPPREYASRWPAQRSSADRAGTRWPAPSVPPASTSGLFLSGTKDQGIGPRWALGIPVATGEPGLLKRPPLPVQSASRPCSAVGSWKGMDRAGPSPQSGETCLLGSGGEAAPVCFPGVEKGRGQSRADGNVQLTPASPRLPSVPYRGPQRWALGSKLPEAASGSGRGSAREEGARTQPSSSPRSVRQEFTVPRSEASVGGGRVPFW